MDKNWVKIFSTSESYKAEILKGLLLENSIEAVIINKKDSAYLFGELELYVRVDNLLKAKRIITTHNEK
ncbi:MAG: DUF2007 domain-containing protein [Bacteroidetes bacterium]|nr:DUF2007 domain-containing protein [Bacteroidota bacterium]MBL7103456.1 DUF2007 domain-containing protein [Bacteroidales bacterium]